VASSDRLRKLMQACQKFRGVVIDASTARCGQWEQVCFWFRTQPDLCPEFAKTEVDLPRDALRRTRGAPVHNSQLQKSPSRISGQISGNSVDISKAFFGVVIWKFESFRVSQAVERTDKVSLISAEKACPRQAFAD
jgi:hypothetical protein